MTELSKGKALGREELACYAPPCGQLSAIESPGRATLVQPDPPSHSLGEWVSLANFRTDVLDS